MKTKLLSLLALLPILFLTTNTSAQTVLTPGDIAVIQNQADTPDDFAFVTFVNIAAGTGIYFTDCGTDTVGFRTPACTEGAVKYTVPAGGLSIGDIVKYASGGNADFATYTDARITGGFGMSTSGDQVIAFQDSTDPAGGTNAANTPTFLFVIHNSSTIFAGSPTDSNETSLPPGLSDTGLPRTALGLGMSSAVDDEWDNTIYMGTYDFSGSPDLASSITAAKIALTNPANYAQSNSITDATYAAAVTAMPAVLMLFTLSTETVSLDKALALYPNPSNGRVIIKNSGIALESIQITSINGRVVVIYNLNGAIEDKEIDLSGLSTGMYLVKLSSNKASTVKKLIIR